MKKSKATSLLLAALLIAGASVHTARAFSDLNDEQRAPIQALKERGIVSGVDSEHFAPQSQATYAEALQLLVKGLSLNIDNLKFIKAPQASDYFTSVPDDAWYAKAFVIAQLNGLPIPKDVNPNAAVTREEFADLLVRAVETKGTFPLVKMMVVFEDADQISPERSGAVQRLALYKIEKLDGERKFYPKRALTRGEAAVWVHRAIELLDAHPSKGQPAPNPAPSPNPTPSPPPAPAPAPGPQEAVRLTVEKVNDDINKVTLSRGEKPSSGYDIAITGIRFEAGGRAVISYTLTDPKPGSMNATVITTPKAETFVSSKYKPQAESPGGTIVNPTAATDEGGQPIY